MTAFLIGRSRLTNRASLKSIGTVVLTGKVPSDAPLRSNRSTVNVVTTVAADAGSASARTGVSAATSATATKRTFTIPSRGELTHSSGDRRSLSRAGVGQAGREAATTGTPGGRSATAPSGVWN